MKKFSTLLKKSLFLLLITSFLVSITVLLSKSYAQEDFEPAMDADGAKDCPYFTRMPNYRIVDDRGREFDSYKFLTNKGYLTIEGRLYQLDYAYNSNTTCPSELQVMRNYTNAALRMGGEVLYTGEADQRGRISTVRLKRNNQEIWMEINPYNDGDDYTLTVIAKQSMQQAVKGSELLFQDLNIMGHVPLNINFDFGKSTIRPESMRIINDIAEMMKSNPTLKLRIEGHTDNVGNSQSNKVLSGQRAKAVVNALVIKGISITRLTAVGYGQERPVADNSTEMGRAQNRRVEIVKI